jgi:hypothetical protein
MTRVTFDPYYIDDLQDYYRRNDCIREQQYLSQEKLLHLAAFCISKVAIDIDEKGKQRRNELKEEAALDVVRQLSALCDNANPSDACLKPVIVVIGHTSNEAATRERSTLTLATTTFAAKVIMRLRRMIQVAFAAIRGRHRAEQRPLQDPSNLASFGQLP